MNLKAELIKIVDKIDAMADERAVDYPNNDEVRDLVSPEVRNFLKPISESDIAKLSPQERVAEYIVRDAQIAAIGARLRTKYKDVSTDYNEGWSKEEEDEWDYAVEDMEVWFYALNEEEKTAIKHIDWDLGCLTRAEWPISKVPDSWRQENEIRYVLTTVHFHFEPDIIQGITVLYINDDYYTEGAFYGDHIGDVLNGFKCGLRYAKEKGWDAEILTKDYYITERVESKDIPKSLKEVKKLWKSM